MKKSFKLLASMMAIVLVALTSCSKDDDPVFGNKKDVYGTWASQTTEADGSTVTYTYIFNENGTGYAQQSVVYADNLLNSYVKEFDFTFTLSEPSLLTGKMKMDITKADGTVLPTIEVKYMNGKLAIGNDIFEKAELNKDLVGTWVMQERSDVGTPDETTDTYTYVFKKDGTGSAKAEFLYVKTGVTDTQSYTFTWTLTAADANGIHVLVTTIDGSGEKDTYNVTINGDVMTLDGDTLYRKK